MSDDPGSAPVDPHIPILLAVAHQIRLHHAATIRFRGCVLNRMDMVSLREVRFMLSIIRGQRDALVTTFDQLLRHVNEWLDKVGDEVNRHG